jgi:predicted metal-dependent phosphoesterase TrpH
MGIRADLHLHTVASDGRWTPEELIDQVRGAGIGLFAVTDHDALGSLVQVTDLVKGSGLRFLPGVELSARVNGRTYHLLAYGFDVTDPALNELSKDNNRRLIASSDEAVELLHRVGYSFPLEEYENYAWDRRRGGWKALNFLVDHGICQGVRSYFELFDNGLAHPVAEFPHAQRVIATAQRAGGVVSLAHPGASFHDDIGTEQLDELVEMGLQGVECYSFHHDAVTTQGYVDYCQSRNLLVTGGSDCHGGFAGRALGVPPVHAADLRLGVLEERIVS